MISNRMRFCTAASAVAILLLAPWISPAEEAPAPGRSVSPARGINFPPGRGQPPRRPPVQSEWRSIDGSGNNLDDTEMGATYTHLRRIAEPDYDDGIATLAGALRPGPREISNAVSAQVDSFPNRRRASDLLWSWGQFLDHDIDLSEGTDPAELADIAVPDGDAYFASDYAFGFNRSIYDKETGTAAGNPRQQLNEITAWIDASNVYGSDAERAAALRTNDGTGRLRTSAGDLLPFNTDGLANATAGGAAADSFFLAGDVRANEHVGLTALHTLFVREHNRLANRIAAENPDLSGEEIYQTARRIVGAQIQVITYNEFLPLLLGPRPLPAYEGYDPTVDGRIINAFSTAIFRLGHSMLNATLLRLDAAGDEVDAGHLALRDAFFNPSAITEEGGIEPLLRGLAGQTAQAIDPYVIDDVRNFLFANVGGPGFDLVSLNIQRGRDHGLPGYNDMRRALGLEPVTSFADVSSDAEIRSRLAAVYEGVEDVDLWAGGLAEDPLPGALVGELIATVMKRQFQALRDGDRFWYRRTLDPATRSAVERTRLSDIIRRNTKIGRELRNDVFRAPRGAP